MYAIYFVQIDPVRTISAGKVTIGAFRTYPKVSLVSDRFGLQVIETRLFIDVTAIIDAFFRAINLQMKSPQSIKLYLSIK